MITKGTKFCVVGTTGKTEGSFKVMAEDFSKLMTRNKLQLQENTKKDTYPGIFTKANHIQTAENQRHRKILKDDRGRKHFTYRGIRTRIYLTDLFTKHASKKEWSGMFNVLKEKKKKKTSSLETVSSEVILKKLRRNTFSNKQKMRNVLAVGLPC